MDTCKMFNKQIFAECLITWNKSLAGGIQSWGHHHYHLFWLQQTPHWSPVMGKMLEHPQKEANLVFNDHDCVTAMEIGLFPRKHLPFMEKLSCSRHHIKTYLLPLFSFRLKTENWEIKFLSQMFVYLQDI